MNREHNTLSLHLVLEQRRAGQHPELSLLLEQVAVAGKALAPGAATGRPRRAAGPGRRAQRQRRPSADHPEGKLRLLYECAPLALVAEQVGGRASTGRRRILDVLPGSTHQRVPLVIGSRDIVAEYERFQANARG